MRETEMAEKSFCLQPSRAELDSHPSVTPLSILPFVTCLCSICLLLCVLYSLNLSPYLVGILLKKGHIQMMVFLCLLMFFLYVFILY